MPKKHPEARVELINHLAEQFAGILEEKNANVAEMGMSAIVLLQTMVQYGVDNHLEVPAHQVIETPEGFRYSYRIEKIKPENVPVTSLGLIKGKTNDS